MFSSLAGMPLSEYVRRRRMTVAAADVVRGEDDLLSIAVRHGYGSTEAFGRAFRAVHGASPGDVRRDGGPLRAQPQVRFRLTVEGSTPHGHPHRRPPRFPAHRTRGPGSADPPRHQPAHPAAHRRAAAGGAMPAPTNWRTPLDQVRGSGDVCACRGGPSSLWGIGPVAG
ncbi:helix-turn-helix domain-containing protein [Dactylosporangium sp. NPDC051484]|uniref:helix-turn-helix domain-containing protein n=1 Tax=Dactylosporangium sp. NPDC051484 TaxID=3154942 RepID=UPI00344EE2AD